MAAAFILRIFTGLQPVINFFPPVVVNMNAKFVKFG